jgi:hypothetical protein
MEPGIYFTNETQGSVLAIRYPTHWEGWGTRFGEWIEASPDKNEHLDRIAKEEGWSLIGDLD